MTAIGTGPVFRFEPGTTGRLGRRRITFLRAASTGYLVEVLPHPEAENIPEVMRGTRPDIEFTGRRMIPHAELTAALVDGTLDIDEGDHVFIDHSQTFKPEFVASLTDRPANDLILRYATVILMRELAKERDLGRPSRRQVRALEPEILRLLPGRIDLLTGKVDRLRRHPFRRREKPLHVATAQTILDWDERLTARGFTGLVDMLHVSGNDTCKLAPEVAEILKEEIDRLCSLETAPNTAIHEAVERRVVRLREEREAELRRREAAGEPIEEEERKAVAALKPPSLKTVGIRVKRIGPLEQAFRGKGPDWLLGNQLVTGLGLQVERAGQIVVIDEYDADLMSVVPFDFLVHWLGPERVAALGITGDKPFRVVFSVMIEAFTGCILGLQIGLSADQDLAGRTFMMAMTDKTKIAAACGAESAWDQFLRPEKVLHDSGNAYIAAETERMCALLRMDKIAAPKAKPFIRGLMERIFRTVHERLLARIPGKTFSNPVKRGAYDSEAEAVLTIDDLIQVLIVWIVDIYHNSPNLGRDGLTPADLWRHEMAVGMGCRPVPGLRVMTHVFGTTLTRRAQGTGIRIMHANYSSEEFARVLLRSPTRAFRVRWWEENMSEAQVEVKPRVWMPLEVMDPRARGLSVDEWMLVLQRAHVARDPEAAAIRRRAGEKIDDRIEDRIATRRKVRRKTMTEERLLQAEERALRFFKTPTTEITSAETHGLYGVPVGTDHDEDGVVREAPVAAPAPEAARKTPAAAAPRGRRPNPRVTPGTME